MERVNIQSDSARLNQIVDGEWVCVGLKKDYAILYDYDVKFDGKPSYRFELKKMIIPCLDILKEVQRAGLKWHIVMLYHLILRKVYQMNMKSFQDEDCLSSR